VGATIVDGLILGVVRTIFASAVGTVGGDVIYLGVYAAYAILLIGAPRGQTVGNMALSSRVVDAATGQPPGVNKAAVRWVVELVLNITIVGGIIDVLWPLWDPRNQTLHDKAAGTVVIHST
jgi:uncharacterized RDD family membrane protein YckC